MLQIAAHSAPLLKHGEASHTWGEHVRGYFVVLIVAQKHVYASFMGAFSSTHEVILWRFLEKGRNERHTARGLYQARCMSSCSDSPPNLRTMSPPLKTSGLEPLWVIGIYWLSFFSLVTILCVPQTTWEQTHPSKCSQKRALLLEPKAHVHVWQPGALGIWPQLTWNLKATLVTLFS